VTVLDKIFYPDELDSLSSSLPSSARYPGYRSSLLTVQIGDIRNTTLLSEVITPDVVGVIHLAAVSRVLWCLENEADCSDVNERGTQVVLDALTVMNGKDKGKRWFILASSREVYGNPSYGDEKPTTEDAERRPANVYGASKLAAENVVTKHLAALKARKAPGTLRVIALRLSNVYGGVYDHLERLIPSITTQALSHQVIQISGGQQNVSHPTYL
jgi:nucleoside-diphosphate-sugar epimerase